MKFKRLRESSGRWIQEHTLASRPFDRNKAEVGGKPVKHKGPEYNGMIASDINRQRPNGEEGMKDGSAHVSI